MTTNFSASIFLANPKVRAIAVQYEQHGKVSVFKTLDQDIQKDDIVVVPTGTDKRWGFTTNKVVDVDVDVEYEGYTEYDWIVARVDQKAYSAIKEMEANAIKKMREAEKNHQREEMAKKLEATFGKSAKELSFTVDDALALEDKTQLVDN